MSIAAPKAVAVIGAGFSGLICAIHLLLKSSRGGPRIYLIERRETFGAGAAYSTDNPGHLLNTRASNMSVFADRPDHFLNWLQDRGRDLTAMDRPSSPGGSTGTICPMPRRPRMPSKLRFGMRTGWCARSPIRWLRGRRAGPLRLR